MLEQVFHHFSSQKSESLHQQASRVAPKDKHFSGTMLFSDCVALVVITDSVGYEEGMRMIFKEIGFVVPPVTMQYMIRRNKRRKYNRMYHQRPEVKTKRNSSKKENIRKTLEQKAKDAQPGGMNYGPSIDVTSDDDEDQYVNVQHGDVVEGSANNENSNVASAGTTKRKSRKDTQCKNCPLMGHATWRSLLCKEHEAYLAQRAGKLVVCVKPLAIVSPKIVI